MSTGFIVMRTLPATYVYRIYRRAHSARHVSLRDLESHAKLLLDLESSFRLCYHDNGIYVDLEHFSLTNQITELYRAIV